MVAAGACEARIEGGIPHLEAALHDKTTSL